MKKGSAILGVILNIIIIGAIAFAFTNYNLGFLGSNPTQFTVPGIISLAVELPVCAALFLGLSGIISLISDIAIAAGKKPRAFPAVFKVISVAFALAATVFAIIGLGIIGVNGKVDPRMYNDYTFYLYLTTVAPVIGLISVFIENKPRVRVAAGWFALLLPVAYFGLTLLGVYAFPIQGVDFNPYGLYNFAGAELVMNIVWIAVIAIAPLLLSFLFLALRKAGKKEEEVVAEPAAEEKPAEEDKEEPAEEAKEEPGQEEEKPAEEVVAAPVKEEPEAQKVEEPIEEEKPVEEAKEEPVQEEEPKPEPEPEVKEEPKPEPKPAPVKPAPRPAAKPATPTAVPTATGGPRVYHIAKHPSGQWSVKLASSNKVIKLFKTQAEAIGYTKGLVESRGGSYRIHGVSGKLRKE